MYDLFLNVFINVLAERFNQPVIGVDGFVGEGGSNLPKATAAKVDEKKIVYVKTQEDLIKYLNRPRRYRHQLE